MQMEEEVRQSKERVAQLDRQLQVLYEILQESHDERAQELKFLDAVNEGSTDHAQSS